MRRPQTVGRVTGTDSHVFSFYITNRVIRSGESTRRLGARGMFEHLKKAWDWIAISVGFAALLCNLLLPNEGLEAWACNILSVLAGIMGIQYAFSALYLWCCNRPQFDWHLINGHFLRKVCCLVLLMPSTLTLVVMLNIDSPKELVYESELYEEKDSNLEYPIKSWPKSPNIYWSVYYHFIDQGNQHMTTTKRGRAWAALIGILGMFMLNGLLVSSIIGYIDRRKERWMRGDVRYKRFLKRHFHYVVIGGNDVASGIVGQMLSRGGYILIQTSRDVESFRRELYSNLDEEQQERVIIYYGNRISRKDIEELYIEKAKEVYILGEDTRTDDMESYHDTMNMECLRLVCEYMESIKYASNKPDRLVCRVMFEYQTTFSVFQFYDIDKKVQEIIDFRPFNYYEMWAQKVLINKEIDSNKLKEVSLRGGYLPLEGTEGIKKEDDNYVHLFIVGMSRMGVAMAIEAAHLAHYPNYENKKIRTKITFIDKNAAEEKDFFMGRFKELFALSHWRYGNVDNGSLEWAPLHQPTGYEYLGGDFIDIEWEFINGGIEQSAVQDYILASSNPLAKMTIAVCLPESNRSHAAALYLDKRIYESKSVLQVIVYNRYGDSVIKSFRSEEPKHPYLNKLKPFGAPNNCFDTKFLEQSEEVGTTIGNRYKEIKRRYIEPAQKAAKQSEGKGGYKGKSSTAKSWSNIYNGNSIWTKLRSISYTGGKLSQEEKEILSDVEHNRWNMEQLLLNFRPLTEIEQAKVKNEVLRTDKKKDRKEDLKGEMAHLNICSNQCLKALGYVDVAARAYDEGLTDLLPDIYNQLTKENS